MYSLFCWDCLCEIILCPFPLNLIIKKKKNLKKIPVFKLGILWPSDQATPPAGTVRNNMNKKTYMFTLLSAKACEKENENEFLVNAFPSYGSEGNGFKKKKKCSL